MSVPWYRTYFAEDYWRWAESEREPAQTERENDYLRLRLGEAQAGPRVLCIGAGVGWHAIPLAQAGYKVTAVDSSAWSVAEARRRCARAQVEVAWHVRDPLDARPWPTGEFDALLCLAAFGWVSDGQQSQLLRAMRNCLDPTGLLLLGVISALHSSDPWLAGRSARDGDDSPDFVSHYEARTGRVQGYRVVGCSSGSARRYEHDVRLFSPVELVALLRRGGFDVLHVDADFKAGVPIAPSARTTQLVARPWPVPPISLAVPSWRTPSEVLLDLRYAPDETHWTDPSPERIWESIIDDLGDRGLQAVGHYPVDDPYGGERAVGVVARCFDASLVAEMLTFGAGVTALLRHLSYLADGGVVLSGRLTHPDLAAWAIAQGCSVEVLEQSANGAALTDAITLIRPSLVHLDRPTLAGELISRGALERVCLAAARYDGIVLVDESAATYLGPPASTVSLVPEVDNLVVLRGFTKAYSWGGARVGFAVASARVAARVRELVPPLQVGELSMRGALRLLEAGDLFDPLRRQIAQAKPRFAGVLQAAGLHAQFGHPALPWLLVQDRGSAASRMLAERGIHGTRVPTNPVLRGAPSNLLQLFAPLSDARADRLCALLANTFAKSGAGS